MGEEGGGERKRTNESINKLYITKVVENCSHPVLACVGTLPETILELQVYLFRD